MVDINVSPNIEAYSGNMGTFPITSNLQRTNYEASPQQLYNNNQYGFNTVKSIGLRNRMLLACLFLGCLLIIFVTLQSGQAPEVYLFVHLTHLATNLTCYHDYFNDVLPAAEDKDFYPSPRSIFFHETSCKGGLNTRQACAVEAAARAHPHWEIYVLFAAPVHSYYGPIKTLQQFKNVKFSRIHISEYLESTPLEWFVTSVDIKKSQWWISQIPDVLKFTTLYIFGGICLDLDAMVVNPLNDLKKNWAAKESENAISTAAIALSYEDLHLGKLVVDAAAKNFHQLRTHARVQRKSSLMTNILKEICFTENVTEMSGERCQGFEIYGPEVLSVMSRRHSNYYFQPGILNYSATHIFQVSERPTRDRIAHNSRYADMARNHCPTIFRNHWESFGYLNS